MEPETKIPRPVLKLNWISEVHFQATFADSKLFCFVFSNRIQNFVSETLSFQNAGHSTKTNILPRWMKMEIIFCRNGSCRVFGGRIVGFQRMISQRMGLFRARPGSTLGITTLSTLRAWLAPILTLKATTPQVKEGRLLTLPPAMTKSIIKKVFQQCLFA